MSTKGASAGHLETLDRVSPGKTRQPRTLDVGSSPINSQSGSSDKKNRRITLTIFFLGLLLFLAYVIVHFSTDQGLISDALVYPANTLLILSGILFVYHKRKKGQPVTAQPQLTVALLAGWCGLRSSFQWPSSNSDSRGQLLKKCSMLTFSCSSLSPRSRSRQRQSWRSPSSLSSSHHRRRHSVGRFDNPCAKHLQSS